MLNEAIKSSTGYFSVEYLKRATGLETYEIESILSDKSQYRKSFIKGSWGQDIYIVNTPFSLLKDMWVSFRHLNSKKF